MVVRKKDEETIKRLEDELKHRSEVLDISPLRTVIGQEAILTTEFNKLNRIIEIMKVEFKKSFVEDYNKHQLEINEYRKKEENIKNIISKKDEELKGKIVELQKIIVELQTRGVEKLKEFEIGKGQSRHLISGEIYDMSAHQQDLIRYDSSLQNREKELDVYFNAIQAHAEVKNGLQSYRGFLRI